VSRSGADFSEHLGSPPAPQRFPRVVPNRFVAQGSDIPEPLEHPPVHLRQPELETEFLAAPEPMPGHSQEIGGPHLGR
jgi:hypothetical protein